jgi:alpha-L-arabinofuranosidase
MNDKKLWTLIFVMTFVSMISAQPRINIDVSRPGASISPTMYGVFFEDINFGADGGLYAELVKNRSFEFDKPLRGWRKINRGGARGDILIHRDEQRPTNPRYIRVRVDEPGQGYGLSNEGFRGMGIRTKATYNFSVEARRVAGQNLLLQIELVDARGRRLGQGTIAGFSDQWQTRTCTLRANTTEAKARLNVYVMGKGALDLDMVSLFPSDTWKNRQEGLRQDLVQMLADMKPGFLRFPGGCIVEGFDLSQRYQWKNTIGDPNQRTININRWNFEFKHRPAPDYYQSYGLGYYEYFLLAEDLGATPMPIITCGMACQFNTAELVPMDQLAPYVQDALDLIEFANGPAQSRWGKIRADMGHPEPFNMNMLGIGNEQWGPQYIERYKVFARAIKAKYPDMQLIAATGSDATIFPNGREEIDTLWSHWRQLKPEIVDEHFYRKPEWFLENVDWYDDYHRQGSKLFVGEYAAQSVGVASPDNRNNLRCALYEAAFMAGLERNADLVCMTCYAPLFAHEEAWQWRPDLIWFDNLTVYGSANYYVQKLFSLHRGTHLLQAEVNDVPDLRANAKTFHISATLDKETSELVLKAVNVSPDTIATTIHLQNVQQVGPQARVICLTSNQLTDENSLKNPRKVYPQETREPIAGPRFTQPFKRYSLTVLRIPIK